jgi:hypothetical protein
MNHEFNGFVVGIAYHPRGVGFGRSKQFAAHEEFDSLAAGSLNGYVARVTIQAGRDVQRPQVGVANRIHATRCRMGFARQIGPTRRNAGRVRFQLFKTRGFFCQLPHSPDLIRLLTRRAIPATTILRRTRGERNTRKCNFCGSPMRASLMRGRF